MKRNKSFVHKLLYVRLYSGNQQCTWLCYTKSTMLIKTCDVPIFSNEGAVYNGHIKSIARHVYNSHSRWTLWSGDITEVRTTFSTGQSKFSPLSESKYLSSTIFILIDAAINTIHNFHKSFKTLVPLKKTNIRSSEMIYNNCLPWINYIISVYPLH